MRRMLNGEKPSAVAGDLGVGVQAIGCKKKKEHRPDPCVICERVPGNDRYCTVRVGKVKWRVVCNQCANVISTATAR